jgi:16S rRNA (uracil1498-N3)-methyltransferase
MNIFYLPSLNPAQIPCEVRLDGEESYHCIRVLRLKTGSRIYLTDGMGTLYEGSVLDDNSKQCLVGIESGKFFNQHTFYLHIAIAPTKNTDRFEWFLEKATEIGIDEITPLLCEHSERTKLRIDRLQKILVSAMKQSMNLHMPKLNDPITFKEFTKKKYSGQKFIGYVEEKQEALLKNLYQPGSDALLLIGPEGDFSKDEVQLSVENGFQVISLGNSRLRTETAGIVACMTVNIANY